MMAGHFFPECIERLALSYMRTQLFEYKLKITLIRSFPDATDTSCRTTLSIKHSIVIIYKILFF